MFDVKKAQEDAAKELVAEAAEKAKARIKIKLREIAAAEKIVANHKRELEDLYGELSNN